MSEGVANPKETVTIRDNSTGRSIDLPILRGTEGPAAFDIGQMYKQFGMFAFDPGFRSTASCASRITFVDGDRGKLLYRGYPVEQLAEQSSYLEVCYLLWYGVLPTKAQHLAFVDRITHHTLLHEGLRGFYSGFRHDAHPMAIMVGVVGALSAFYPEALRIHDPMSRELSALRLIAKLPTIAAWAYRYSKGEPFPYPQNHLSYTENFLHMMFSFPSEPYEVNHIAAKALDRLFLVHADHEQNASTSTIRMAGSSQANPFACVSASVGTLWGPAHGGANEAVIKMLEEIGDIERIPQALARAKDKDDDFRLMGFGHRVYKEFDPRARIIRQTCHEVLRDLQIEDPLFGVAMALEQAALQDPYFQQRKLYPNVDFYSGIILRALGIPTNMFTVIFTLGRAIGWISQWDEMTESPRMSISRPRQLYQGPTARNYTPIDERG